MAVAKAQEAATLHQFELTDALSLDLIAQKTHLECGALRVGSCLGREVLAPRC
jgi:hypothetical protein